MGIALVIVESPAKAKTINKFLGKDYIVKPSMGHIRDLPTNSLENTKNSVGRKNKKIKLDAKYALVNRMGIDPYNDWKAHYEILPGKERVVTELKALAKTVDHIYLATDLDREGEAIAWHLRTVIGGSDKRFSRVVFNEITQNAITKAFKKPVELNINRVNAQQARRFMDRIVGYMVSPLLWKKIARGLSAGRVQSVAVRLVVKREREIKIFMPTEYWELHGRLKTPEATLLTMQVTHYGNKPFKPVNNKQIQFALDNLKNANYVVIDSNNKITTSKPVCPFTTSTLQQAANTHLCYGVKRTMVLAQRLYESGYITYMRTDSTNLSQDALKMVRDYIFAFFGSRYLPTQPNRCDIKNKAQEAHEAIRPSNINILSEHLKDMESDAKKLYQLIWQQFVACQMMPAEYNSAILTVAAGKFQLRVRNRTLIFDGWTKIMLETQKKSEVLPLPVIESGQILTLVELVPSQHFTKPPPRYSEASLVKELEQRSIGRPSTYASIISTIQDRGYVHIKNRRFYAEKIGEIVTDRLEEHFDEIMNYNFTANMENSLDKVASNQQEWKQVLDTFFHKFSQHLKKAEKAPEEGGMQLNPMLITSIKCKVCYRNMGIRTATTGVFLGCSGYLLASKLRCKNTINLISELEPFNIQRSEDKETKDLFLQRRCSKCNTAMDTYLVDRYSKIYVCGNNPLCDSYDVVEGNFGTRRYDGSVVECDKCRSDMQLKLGRFGKFMACTNNECKNTRKVLSNGDIAPPKEDPIPLPKLQCKKSDAYFVLRNGASGIFLAANTFPKSRETRAPLVAELARFRDCLPERLRYLADAPIVDDEGNNTSVHFNRKTKQQYITSEQNGKTTGWSAFYIDNKWQVRKKQKRRLSSSISS
ncbi:DNA topoisomerase I, bacterial [secondary endosymbiont of Heteropsylla cubana]|uniref:DNA topoisomerase 1 n=1 Tax=secondary endosymbiont of Heteropsylla cubana TaxID=134287 RepID=J3Z606_9ENTR|nr:type I DNA topoisomerase [secondary endosymbiont of Heteropsylla cubana]AFP85804.1 DNA topoisomerase I, bacterial [secondary endosymbiont of Heteropsylla cubana]